MTVEPLPGERPSSIPGSGPDSPEILLEHGRPSEAAPQGQGFQNLDALMDLRPPRSFRQDAWRRFKKNKLAMGGLVLVQVAEDVAVLRRLSFGQRVSQHALTTIELCLVWSVLGVLLYLAGRRSYRSAE